jgi:hypothetical protein
VESRNRSSEAKQTRRRTGLVALPAIR